MQYAMMVETEMEQTVSELRETELGDKNHKRKI